VNSPHIPATVVAKRAYELWQARGCPYGSPEVDWFRAERELRGSRGHDPANDSLIQPDEIVVALQSSGYLLEGRIGRLLQQRGCFVEFNTLLKDPRNDADTIELDVHGQYFEWVSEARECKSMVMASLLVECKNNSQPVALFVQPIQIGDILNENRWHYGGFPISSADPETSIHVPLHRLIEMKTWHHYCTARQPLATHFCGFVRDEDAENKKRQGQDKKKPLDRRDWCWKADDMKQYAQSFTRLALATVLDSCATGAVDIPNIQLDFTYPIVVFAGPVYAVQQSSDGVQVYRVDHLQMHHAVSIGDRTELVQFDIVEEAAFLRVVEIILAELKTIATRIDRMYDRLIKSAVDQKQIARQRRLTSSVTSHLSTALRRAF
jgi:Protein of unknown function (DUF2934)